MLQTSSVMRCPKCDVGLKAVWTDKGVVVDSCEKCKGTWLDGGEIYHFSTDPSRIHWALAQGLRDPHPTRHACPRCRKPLVEGGLLSDELQIDHCPECEGVWLDAEELDSLRVLAAGGVRAAPAAPLKPRPPTAATAAGAVAVAALPNLYVRSAGVLALLYGLLFLVLALGAEAGLISLAAAVVVTVVIAGLQFALSPFIMDWLFQWTLSLRWVERATLPPHLAAFTDRIAQKHGIAFPRFGIIEDGTPTAFTYGHSPQNARVVISRGLLDLLEPDEVEAVVAHEIGHAVHWDMLFMTVAALVPMILYFVFRVAIRMRGDKNPGPIIAAVAYILYIVSEYVILWLSRTREYWADRFAGEATGKPAALASALTKIAYGLAGSQARRKLEEEAAKGNRDAEARLRSQDPGRLDAVHALGIFDPGSARALVATSVGELEMEPGKTPRVDPERMKDAMQWDLWNPWAGWYEFNSTHPLPAKRIHALGDLSEAMGQKAFLRFDRARPESYWDDFILDLSVLLAPIVGAVGGLALGFSTFGTGRGWAAVGVGVLGFALGALARTLYSYRGQVFPRSSVAGLLKHVKVSAVTPVPAELHGKIIGRGIPGLIWSEDLVLQDATGYIFLDYRQPLGIIEFFFGLFRTPGIIGREVTVTGWYRRAPVPYFELKSLTYRDGTQRKDHGCYVLPTKIVVEAALVVVGLILMIAA